MYKPLKIKLDEISGLKPALKAMRFPKAYQIESTFKDDIKLGSKLIKAGDDHGKFSRGIVVWLEMEFQAGFMVEFDTYRHGVETLSTSSSMHNELKELTGEELANQKQLVLSTKVYKREAMISYQALRRIYKQRRHHRHPDWQLFCDFIETLPYAKQFIIGE